MLLPSRTHLLLFLPVLIAAVCAQAAEDAEERRLSDLALDRMLAGQIRIMRVADPIRVAGLPFCEKELGPVLGAYAADRHSFPDLFGDRDYAEPFIKTAADRFELQRAPRVLAVVPGSPADAAGLRQGDLILKIDGKKLKKGTQLDALPRKHAEGKVVLSVQREDGSQELEIEVVKGCAFASRYFFGPVVNAFATRFGNLTGIYIFDGMLEFLPSDDYLAVVLGHELAHFLLKHHGTPRGSRRLEADADYLGLYITARAGFDVSVAPDLWDRMTRMSLFSTIDGGVYSHPTSGDRALALQATLEEIDGKIVRGEPLEPETK